MDVIDEGEVVVGVGLTEAEVVLLVLNVEIGVAVGHCECLRVASFTRNRDGSPWFFV